MLEHEIDSGKELMVDTDSLRFAARYASRLKINAKKMVLHLLLTRRGDWKQHIDGLVGISEDVIAEMRRSGLETPVVSRDSRTGLYVVREGAEAAYAHWEKGISRIGVIGMNSSYEIPERIYAFEELKVE